MRLLTDILYDNLERDQNKRALAIKLRYRTLTWNYQDLFQFAQGIAKILEERGVKKGDRVILWAANSPYWIGTFFGCLLRGAIVVPMHTENTPEFIQKVIEQTEPKLFFKSSDLEWTCAEPVECVDIDYFGTEKLLESGSNSFSPNVRGETPHIVEDDIAEILYTSGTTGEPKGVVLTHRNIVSNLDSIWDIIPIDKSDRILSILPLSHIFEQVVEFRVLAASAFIVYAPALSSSLIKKTLREYHVNKMAAVPEFLKRIITRIESEAERKGKARLLSFLFFFTRTIPIRAIRRAIFSNIHKQFGGKLDLVISGGAALDSKIARKWQLLGMRIIQGYGLTETSSVISTLSPNDSNIISVGKIIPGVEVKISEGKEILVKGLNVTQGYYKNKEKTKELFTEDGWLKTGDLGSLDEAGYLYIRGRKKFMILTPAGQNVYPEDIEAELNKEPGVKDSAVMGLEKDGTILIHAELLGDIKNLEEVIARVNQRLASFQQIQSWSVWPLEDFPRTITRKVKKYEVLDYLKKREIPRAMRGPKEAASPLARILSDVLGKPANLFTKDIRVVSLGLDSLARIELVARIEEELGVEIDESQITPATRVVDLERLIEEKPSIKIKYVLRGWPRHPIIRQIRAVLFRIFIAPIFRIFIDLRVEGLENIENLAEPIIFMPNHISDIDAPIIHLALPGRIRRNLAAAAAADVLFKKFWFVQPIITFLLNSYPFSRKGQARLAFKYTGELIDKGWSILVFPGGRISHDPYGALKLMGGTGVMAVEMQVPVVPVKIEGSNLIMPRGTHFPRRRGKVTVRFGKPLCFNPKTSYKEATGRIQEELRDL